MGTLKNKSLNNQNEDVTEHQLTESEATYLRLLHMSLTFHTHAQRIMSGFLYYVATTRLGYKEGSNLQFEFDFNKEDDKVKITLLPAELSPDA